MAIPHAMVLQLANRGINTVHNLINSDETTLKLMADNMKNPGSWIPNPDPIALLEPLFDIHLSHLTENVAKDTFKGSLFDCQENVSNTTLTIV